MKAFSRFLLLGFFCLAGCGGGGEGAAERPETAPVKVTVNYKGAAVENATVTFSPKPSQEGRAAFGKTDRSGVARLKTSADTEGVVPGEYNVAIIKVERQAGTVISMDDPAYDGAESVKETPPKSLIPKKYSNAASSGLSSSVKAGQDNPFVFNLED
jgi:hypothetical protein